VILHDRQGLAGNRYVQAAQAVEVAAAAPHQVPQVLDIGGLIHLFVKGLVGQHETVVILGLECRLLLRDERLQAGYQHRLRRGGQQMHQLQLDRLPQEMRLLGRRHIDRPHHRRMLGKDVDQPFLFQPQQGVADRRQAQVEIFGQLDARQHGARLDGERNDHAPQMVENLRRRMTLAVQLERNREFEGAHDGFKSVNYSVKGWPLISRYLNGLLFDTLIY
jgi:hypothetical protein